MNLCQIKSGINQMAKPTLGQASLILLYEPCIVYLLLHMTSLYMHKYLMDFLFLFQFFLSSGLELTKQSIKQAL